MKYRILSRVTVIDGKDYAYYLPQVRIWMFWEDLGKGWYKTHEEARAKIFEYKTDIKTDTKIIEQGEQGEI